LNSVFFEIKREPKETIKIKIHFLKLSHTRDMHNQQPGETYETLLRGQAQQRYHHSAQASGHPVMTPLPGSRAALQKEIRFNMAYCQANRLHQTAKWLGELLVTV
jgi:hypothetical protein